MCELSEVDKRKNGLACELDGEIGYAESKALANHRLSLVFMAFALACSFAAAICGIFLNVPAKIVGGIAILPPLIGYIAVNLKFEAKSMWHYRKSHNLRALKSQLKYQLPEFPEVHDIAAVASERDRVNNKMLEEWKVTLTLNWTGILNHQGSIPQSDISSAAPTPAPQDPAKGTS
jgi:hypothetical protein